MVINKVTIFLLLTSMLKGQYTQTIAPSTPTTNKYFGELVIDDYRNLENLENSRVKYWLQEQTSYSTHLIDKIPNKDYYVNKRLELDNRKSFSVDQINITDNNWHFYLLKKPTDRTAKLYYRNGFEGNEIEIFNPEAYKTSKDLTHIITYIKPNYDGSKVAIAITESGKEISEIIIYDLKQKRLLSDVISNSWPADSGGISWLPDNKSFIYLHYPTIDPKSDLFLKDMVSVVYKIDQKVNKRDSLLSKVNNPELKLESQDFPVVTIPSKDSKYLFGVIAGATNYYDTYYKALKNIQLNKWELLFSKEDKIRDFIVKGDELIYISEKNNINGIFKTSIIKPDFKNTTNLISGITNEQITKLHNIKDGFIFTSSRNGIESRLYLYKNGHIEMLNLPFPVGNISVNTKNALSNDFWIICSGWKNDTERFKYDYLQKKFIGENLSPIGQYPEFKDIIIEELVVKSHDGLDIPFTLLYKKNITKNSKNPLLIDAYGAYGTSISPYFAKTYLLWVLNGGIAAVAHVRGGGEKGEQWRVGGFKETKPNSWKDLISCAEFMVKENYTSPDKIAIWGASAGGITVGRAMTERPDLFKAVIIESGILNPLRIESMPNGLNSVKEFGSINNENGFKGLLEMDAYHHIKKSVNYPATYITSGINDPRVSPWMPAKFAAKLLANNTSKNPILLKIDYEGGHGGSIPLAQRYSNLADVFAFAFWQLGHPDYQQVGDSSK